MVRPRGKAPVGAEGGGNCSMCTLADNQEMVQCDNCDMWFHFICVGVDRSIAHKDWVCGKCNPSTAGLDQIQGEEDTILAEDETSPTVPNMDMQNKVGACENGAAALIVSSKSRHDVDIQLQRLEEEHKLSMLFIERKYAIMSTQNRNTFEGQQVCDIRELDNTASAKFDNQRIQPDCIGMSNGRDIGYQPESFNAQPQFYARQMTPPELPIFSGKSEEWPLFISSYEISTKTCGISNEENLLRLQRALKGKALEYVGSKLTLPVLVPQVISTLRMLFGKPEHIIQNLVVKLRAGPNVNPAKLETLVHFSLDVKNIVATMEAANLISHLCNPMLINELVERLPAQMKLDWAMHSRRLNAVNLTVFSDWLFTLAEAASSVVNISTVCMHDNEKRKTQRVNIHDERNNYDKGNKKKCINDYKCYGCGETGHFIAQCADFRKLDYQRKWRVVNEKNLCRSCLKVHNQKACRERKECGTNECKAKHHPLLHKPCIGNISSDEGSIVSVHNLVTSIVLYRVVPMTIHANNKTVKEYAFLDEGSGPTLIEKSVMAKLGLKGLRSELCIKWTDGSVRVENDSERIDLEVSPTGKDQTKFILKDVQSISKLDLPKQSLIFSELTNKYKHLRGLPVESYKNITPRIIIGLNNRRVAMNLKAKEGQAHEPAALKTRLGWTVYGTVYPEVDGKEYMNASLQLHICECGGYVRDDEAALDQLMKSNMKLENDDVTNNMSSVSNDIDIRQYVQRTGNQFTVKLLWKYENLTMPDNYDMALKRLLCFERKLERNHGLKGRVNDKILDMQKKGYIRKLEENEIDMRHPRKWYLPIFVVNHPNKPEKMRLVWDAAAEYRGVSLNGYLNKGPDLVTPLINVLFNFRVGKIGISGDISEMFHRFAVDTEDMQSQRFLWRSNNANVPDVYVLQVMSFEASCSPSLAQCVKNCNAERFTEASPRAVKSITHRHYVDDLLDSVDTVEEAIRLAQQVRQIHEQGNFYIRNWMSNSKEVLAAMGEEKAHNSFCQAGRKVENVIEPEKVLGMWWRTNDDVFTYDLKFTKASGDILSGKRLPTKRQLLRLLMSIFDPMGLLAFYTVQMKILLQNVWRSGTEWDETISESLSEEWYRWLSVLKEVEKMEVPRCYFQGESSQQSSIQLHMFVDASENAYAAVAYFRIETSKETRTALVCSKTKVAPLRPISIPRMELLAAVLGARLARTIIDNHDLKIESTHLWTDSRTVLQWLKSDPRSFKQFVMFRVAEIQEITDGMQWRYIPSKENVVDLATKWARKPAFDSNKPWFIGPSFLQHSIEQWPAPMCNENPGSGNKIRYVAVQAQRDFTVIDYYRFSKWERLLRSMAFVKRFIEQKIFHMVPSDNVNLTSEQLLWGERFLIRLVQSHAYPDEIKLLRTNNASNLPKTSGIRKLSPFLDGEMILRLRSRLENATVIPNETKNPTILPRNHYITSLIVDYYHRKYKHVHHETVINELFKKYHIPGLRALFRTIRYRCQVCRNRKVEPSCPEMGPLPLARVSAFTRPFSYAGVDFFGPFSVTVGRRSEKRYGAVFTCLTIRTVHLEMVYSLNTNSCVMAIRNFIARRGMPIQMYSDNGTNLKAAEKELRAAHREIDFQSLQNEFTTQYMKWTFIPPASPHMGGAWERMVRSIKTVLYRIVTPNQRLNDERLFNLFLEVESIINSRPLTYLSLETADQEALTPNHFLLGTTSGNKPPGKFVSSDQYLRKSWRQTQLLADMFWKRWVAEVLPSMTKRTIWFEKTKPIEIGDVVIIVDPYSPRHSWPRGIVNETIVGKDGQVRSVLVKTAHGLYH